MTHGPWITPELLNGEHYPEWPLRWRITARGALEFDGTLKEPWPEGPLFQLHRIYRHFFGIEQSTGTGDRNQYVVTTRIDGKGYVYIWRSV